MGNDSSVESTVISAFLAMLAVWLLGYFAPELMETAPTGLEAGLGGALTVLLNYIIPAKPISG